MSRRLALKNPQRDVCHSNPSSFNHLPTLCTQRRLGTPFSSTTSALFPVRRRGEECVFAIFQFPLSSFQSWVYKVPYILPSSVYSNSFVFTLFTKLPGWGAILPKSEHAASRLLRHFPFSLSHFP